MLHNNQTCLAIKSGLTQARLLQNNMIIKSEARPVRTYPIDAALNHYFIDDAYWKMANLMLEEPLLIVRIQPLSGIKPSLSFIKS